MCFRSECAAEVARAWASVGLSYGSDGDWVCSSWEAMMVAAALVEGRGESAALVVAAASGAPVEAWRGCDVRAASTPSWLVFGEVCDALGWTGVSAAAVNERGRVLHERLREGGAVEDYEWADLSALELERSADVAELWASVRVDVEVELLVRAGVPRVAAEVQVALTGV